MQVTESTPRHPVTMAGIEFLVPAPFAAGHVMTEGEASQLNQVLAENVRNNLVGKTKKEVKEGQTPFTITQEAVDEYIANYEFGVRQGGTREASLSPEEREARKIAREKVTAALKAKGIKINSVPAEKMESLVAEVAKAEPVVKEAKRRVANSQKIALDELDIDLGSGSDEAEEQAAAA